MLVGSSAGNVAAFPPGRVGETMSAGPSEESGPFQRRPPRRAGSRERSAAGRGRASGGEGGEATGGGRPRGPWVVGLAVVALAVAIVVLFVPPLALLDDDADDAEAVDAAATVGPPAPVITRTGVEAALRARFPDIPDSLQPVSPIYDLHVPDFLPGPYVLTIRLNSATQDQRNLGAYTNEDGIWRRLNPALLSDDGSTARVELDEAPDNVAILRRLQFRDMVTGRLPAGEELAAEAVNTITIINPVGFVPAEDGIAAGTGGAVAQ